MQTSMCTTLGWTCSPFVFREHVTFLLSSALGQWRPPTGLHQRTAWVRIFLVTCSASQEVSVRCRTLGNTGPGR